LLEAGAVILPASPAFYSRPQTLDEAADTVVHRILDLVGLSAPKTFRWGENE
jgi:4-hydroxy-3-polyprenylbenzoate decarboxylase